MYELFMCSDLEITKNQHEQGRVLAKTLGNRVEHQFRDKLKKVQKEMYNDMFNTFNEDMEEYLYERDNKIFSEVKDFFLNGCKGNKKWEHIFDGYKGEKFLSYLLENNQDFFIERITDEAIDNTFNNLLEGNTMFSTRKYFYDDITKGYTQDRVIKKLLEQIMNSKSEWFLEHYSNSIDKKILDKKNELEDLQGKIEEIYEKLGELNE